MNDTNTSDTTQVQHLTTDVLFYCKVCKEVIDSPIKAPNKYVYTCRTCKKKYVAFGSRESITNHFHL